MVIVCLFLLATAILTAKHGNSKHGGMAELFGRGLRASKSCYMIKSYIYLERDVWECIGPAQCVELVINFSKI
jgi:hypothetical protein